MTQTLYYGEVHGEGYAKIIVWLKIQFLQQQAHVQFCCCFLLLGC